MSGDARLLCSFFREHHWTITLLLGPRQLTARWRSLFLRWWALSPPPGIDRLQYRARGHVQPGCRYGTDRMSRLVNVCQPLLACRRDSMKSIAWIMTDGGTVRP